MRIVSFITLVFLGTLLPGWLIIVLALAYATKWTAYELIVLATLGDAFFGVEANIPIYTIGAIIIVFGAEWLKPKFLVYN
jgi:hypothetical protein